LGIVNILDLLIATVFQSLFDKYDTDEKIASAKEEELEKALESQENVLQKPVKTVLGKSEESKKCRVFKTTEPLSKLLDAFSAGIHRVLVQKTGEDGKIAYTYISQTDVVRALRQVAMKSEAKVGGILTNTIAELKLNSEKDVKIVTVTSTTPAFAAFRALIGGTKQLSAVPVIEKGALVDTLSASDFRGIRHDTLRLLLLSVTEFLKLSRAKPRQGLKTHKSLVCKGSDVFSNVVERIITSGVHHLWIVNDDDAPTGAISLTDVIRQFV